MYLLLFLSLLSPSCMVFTIIYLKQTMCLGYCCHPSYHSFLNTRILRIQKRIIRSMVAVSARTSCRQLFKELNILTLVSLYIMKVICYIRKHHQFVDLNSNIHAYNTWRKMDIHIQSYNTDLYKISVINMSTKLYNKLPGYINEIDSYKTFKKELKSLLLHSFYSVEEFVAL